MINCDQAGHLCFYLCLSSQILRKVDRPQRAAAKKRDYVEVEDDDEELRAAPRSKFLCSNGSRI